MSETAIEKSIRRRDALNKAEANGEVADGMVYRLSLIKRLDAGEMTLEEVQKELAETKRKAKREGRLTRSDFYKRGA